MVLSESDLEDAQSEIAKAGAVLAAAAGDPDRIDIASKQLEAAIAKYKLATTGLNTRKKVVIITAVSIGAVIGGTLLWLQLHPSKRDERDEDEVATN